MTLAVPQTSSSTDLRQLTPTTASLSQSFLPGFFHLMIPSTLRAKAAKAAKVATVAKAGPDKMPTVSQGGRPPAKVALVTQANCNCSGRGRGWRMSRHGAINRALRLATYVVAEAPILCTHKFAHIVTNKVLLYPIIHSMHLNIPRQIFQSPEYVCERLRRFRRTCMFILHLSDESVAALTP